MSTRGFLWLACEEPERPPDAFVTWHYSSCPGCRVKAEAQAKLFPDDAHVRWLVALMESKDSL